jgi:ABC-type glycerol-3-phosphate transport system substrate-binding protein
MKMKFGVMILAGALALSACGEEECTPEVAQQKMTDLTTKMAAAPEKAAALAPKVQEITTQMAAGGDAAAVCKGLDDMLAELAK